MAVMMMMVMMVIAVAATSSSASAGVDVAASIILISSSSSTPLTTTDNSAAAAAIATTNAAAAAAAVAEITTTATTATTAALDAGPSTPATASSAAPGATVTVIETRGTGSLLMITVEFLGKVTGYVISFLMLMWFQRNVDWFSNDKRVNANKSFDRLGIRRSRLNKHELTLASSILHPDEIQVGFKDIGGLDPIVESLKETVIYPLCMPKVFQSTSGYLGAPKGVLLFGPPGCGKTMLAKALAKESGANFLNVPVSSLVSKWLGDSEKLVHALFSLAKKVQPVIVFIDEIDSFLKERKQNDHEATRRAVAEFLSMWDGLAAGGPSQILVLGATNRPKDIDPAFLRRMPKRFPLALPDAAHRKQILTLLVSKLDMDPSFDLDELVARTDGLSGSDLRELCSNAALAPLREALRALAAAAAEKGSGAAPDAVTSIDRVFRDVDPTTLDLRPVRMTDILSDKVTETGKAQGTDWTLGGLDI